MWLHRRIILHPRLLLTGLDAVHCDVETALKRIDVRRLKRHPRLGRFSGGAISG